MASGSDRDLRPRFNRDPQPPHDPSLPASSGSLDPPPLPPLRSLGSRVRPPPPTFAGSAPRSSRYRPVEQHLEWYRARLAPGGSLDDLSRNLQDTDAQMRAFLDSTNAPAAIMPPRAPPPLSPPLHGHDTDEDSRRSKRRKLAPDRAAWSFKGFSYGQYGQVEPGQLTMEIVSCDGGLYSDEHSYPPENILKNDVSVYCTKSNRCNIVLKHQGGTVFSLKELVIKAPGTKFSCPVREGMVFVAMDSDELLTRTAQYQIQYLASRSHRRGTVIFRHEEDGTGVTRVQSRPLRAYSYGADDDDDDDDDDEEEDEDSRTAQIPPEFTASGPPFNVTTECSDDDSDADGDSTARPRPPRRRTPIRIGALPFESDSDNEEGAQLWRGAYRHWPTAEQIARDTSITATSRRFRPANPSSTAATRGSGGPSSSRTIITTPRGGSRLASGSNNNNSSMTLEEARDASQLATQEAVRAVGGELMAPLARFHIERDRNKCTVRFDPPVSGRFILLKMWSPHQDPQKNIDIQAVVAKGFAGPRFCPAVDLA